jgi:hypothetical protein
MQTPEFPGVVAQTQLLLLPQETKVLQFAAAQPGDTGTAGVLQWPALHV